MRKSTFQTFMEIQLQYSALLQLFIWSAPPTIQRLLLFSIVSLLAGVALGVVYSRDNWNRHPLAKVLSKYGQNWRMIAATINTEYRRVDKFISGIGNTISLVILCLLFFEVKVKIMYVQRVLYTKSMAYSSYRQYVFL